MKKETILINGCSAGLGLDIIRKLKNKYNVYGLSRKPSNKENIFFYNPIINPKMNEYLFGNLKNLKIDHVIHCSGGGLGYKDKLLDLNKLIELFNINFFSIYEINKAIIKLKRKKSSLNIIMIGSIAAFESKASIGYSSAKSTLINYNKLLAENFFKNKITSKLIIPGSFISTEGSMNRLKKSKKKIFNKLEAQIPLGKMQNSLDIINCINFLLDKKSNLLNGSYVSLSNLESKSIFL
ncbi:SDR family oxidoreductase [Candidatus Pelagibacter sp.]|nr:SDR family oxidoreductase [Candidatus Pelagibacter sp.]